MAEDPFEVRSYNRKKTQRKTREKNLNKTSIRGSTSARSVTSSSTRPSTWRCTFGFIRARSHTTVRSVAVPLPVVTGKTVSHFARSLRNVENVAWNVTCAYTWPIRASRMWVWATSTSRSCATGLFGKFKYFDNFFSPSRRFKSTSQIVKIEVSGRGSSGSSSTSGGKSSSKPRKPRSNGTKPYRYSWSS